MGVVSKATLIFRTVRHLSFKQLYFNVFYRLKFKVKTRFAFGNQKGYATPALLQLKYDAIFVPHTSVSVAGNQATFSILNKDRTFAIDQVDWADETHGKLWNYNLNYFEYLFCPALSHEQCLQLITTYCQSLSVNEGGLEPYPISLRGINWIKYLSLKEVQDETFNRSLYFQYKVLMASLEYHLLANHLLENAFSLLFGSYYFRSDTFYNRAKQLLQEELTEQILPDGAHYERSPMYHQIILYRLLDTINLLDANSWKNDDLYTFLQGKAKQMLSFLHQVTLGGTVYPCVKDSAPGVAPTAIHLFSYAKILGLTWSANNHMKQSGYRWIRHQDLHVLADIGEVSPSYQPGHAHADELSFLLWSGHSPILVDTGISTYDKNQRRQQERSSLSHNCLALDDINSSEVWGGFRVGSRANIKILTDTENEVSASHDGFRKQGLLTSRLWKKEKEGLIIYDLHKGNENDLQKAILNLHFHPDIEVVVEGALVRAGGVELHLSGFREISLESFKFATQFNSLVKSKRLSLKPSTKTRIFIKNAS